MKLDRNINDNKRGKYALVKLRRVAELTERFTTLGKDVQAALRFLEAEGVIDYGTTVDSEFFVVRLKDENAESALTGYGVSTTLRGDPEFGAEIEQMARRAGPNHPNCRKPD